MIDGMMTVGDLAHRTGMSAKLIRRFTDRGLIYSKGRSDANYRMYDESAEWCVGVISEMRDLGLTIAKIETIASAYIHQPEPDMRRLMMSSVQDASRRVESDIDRLSEARNRQQQILDDNGRLRALADRDPSRA